MSYNDLVVINNEKISKEKDGFYCDNLDVKSIPEGLSEYKNVYYIARSLKKKGNYKINLLFVKNLWHIIHNKYFFCQI